MRFLCDLCGKACGEIESWVFEGSVSEVGGLMLVTNPVPACPDIRGKFVICNDCRGRFVRMIKESEFYSLVSVECYGSPPW